MKKSYFLHIISIFLIVYSLNQGTAHASAIVIRDHLSVYDLSKNVEIYVDHKKTFTGSDLSDVNRIPNFYKNTTGRVNFGFTQAAYWLRFTLINSLSVPEELYLAIEMSFHDLIELYVPDNAGGYTAIRTGDSMPFHSRMIDNRNFIFKIYPPDNRETTYYLKIISDDSMMLPLSIMTRKAFMHREEKRNFLYGMYYGIILIMVLYNLFIFLSIRDINYLYYIMYTISYFFFQANYNGLSYQMFWPNNPWWHSHSITFFTGIGLMFGLVFARSFLKLHTYLPVYSRITLFLLLASGLMSVVSLFMKQIHGLVVMNVLAALISLLLLYVAIMTYFRGYKPARFFITAWVFFLLGVIAVALVNLGMVPYSVYANHASQVGSIFEITLLSLALADRINTIKKEREIAQAEMIRMQEATRTSLEREVFERTRELEIERNKLREKNEIIIKELTMARKIQQQFIPMKSPEKNIAAFYKPMEEVGGDFYDFIKFRDPNLTGIFLSDVSGHGMPAALITSMIKSVILEGSRRREDPAELLMFVNDIVGRQTCGHFITAFYGIYDAEKRRLLYSNAGHNLPFLINKGMATALEGKHQLALALLSNEVLMKKKKVYQNDSILLPEGTKILFYTDGISEARNDARPDVFFEDAGMIGALEKYSNKSCNDFIVSLYADLVEFRGNENFDDDVCLICIDV